MYALPIYVYAYRHAYRYTYEYIHKYNLLNLLIGPFFMLIIFTHSYIHIHIY